VPLGPKEAIQGIYAGLYSYRHQIPTGCPMKYPDAFLFAVSLTAPAAKVFSEDGVSV
jgi:hypothetical protein